MRGGDLGVFSGRANVEGGGMRELNKTNKEVKTMANTQFQS